jgi:hypothetical protein
MQLAALLLLRTNIGCAEMSASVLHQHCTLMWGCSMCSNLHPGMLCISQLHALHPAGACAGQHAALLVHVLANMQHCW